MKNYIKPTFALASLFPVALATTSCSFDEENAKWFEENIIGREIDWSKAFFDSKDTCEDEIGVDFYCKHTSNGNTSAMKLLNSF